MSLYSIVKLAKQFQKFGGLNKAKFNALRTLPERKEYLENHGYVRVNPLGYGSSRVVYILNSKKALKLAINKAGIAQNRAESKILIELQSKYIPKFYDKAPDDSWIEVELVRPLREGERLDINRILDDPEFPVIKILLKIKNIDMNDASEISNMGISSSGNAVFLDLGGTHKIIDHYYYGKEEAASDPDYNYKYTGPDSTMKRLAPTHEWTSKDPKNR